MAIQAQSVVRASLFIPSLLVTKECDVVTVLPPSSMMSEEH